MCIVTLPRIQNEIPCINGAVGPKCPSTDCETFQYATEHKDSNNVVDGSNVAIDGGKSWATTKLLADLLTEFDTCGCCVILVDAKFSVDVPCVQPTPFTPHLINMSKVVEITEYNDGTQTFIVMEGRYRTFLINDTKDNVVAAAAAGGGGAPEVIIE